jgi:putative nucleotidyltransferase with HDIG domain
MSSRGNPHPPRFKLHHKIVFPFLLALLAGSLVSGFLVEFLYAQQAKEHTSEKLSLAVRNAQRDFYHQIGEVKVGASVLADEVAHESLKRKDLNVSVESLSSLKNLLHLDTVALVDKHGKLAGVLGGSLAGIQIEQLAERFSQRAGVEILAGEKGLSLTAVTPVTSEKGKRGVVVVAEPLGQRFLEKMQEQVGASVAVYFSDRGVSSKPDHTIFDRAVLGKVLREGSQVTVRRSWVMGEEALGYAPLEIEGSRKGVVVVSLPARSGYVFSRIYAGPVAAGAVVSLLLVFFGTWLVSRKVSKPLSELIQSARLISEGRLDQRVPVKGSAELRQFAGWLNAVLEELRSERRRVRKRTIQLSRKVYRLSRLNGLAVRIIGSGLKIDVLVERIVDTTKDLVRADATCLMFLHSRERILSLASAKGWKNIPRENIMLGEGISGWAALKGEPLLLANTQVPGVSPLEWEKEARSAIVVPLRIKGELAGILMAARIGSRDSFEKEDLRLVTMAGHLAASAVGNAWAIKGRECTLLDAVKVLAGAIDARCALARGHSARVAEYAVSIAKKLGLSARETEDLEMAACLHDIGKIETPDWILRNEEPTAEDKRLLETHPQLGRDMLASVHFPQTVLSAVAHHHELYAGGGYPSSLKGDEIPLSARIIAVADAFEKMTSEKLSLPPLSFEDATEELERQSGNRFDPLIITALIEALKQEFSQASSPSQESVALLK